MTSRRRRLDSVERRAALSSVIAGHLLSYDLYVALAMPDHVHFIAWLYEHTTLPRVMKMIKRTSAAEIGRHGAWGRSVWQEEYFDHVIRKSEGVERKGEYVLNNPVRAGLVASTEDYPWKWRAWVEGDGERG